MSAVVTGKSRHPPERTMRLLSRFIFAMKISRTSCAKEPRRRVSIPGRIFGLRIWCRSSDRRPLLTPSPPTNRRLAMPCVATRSRFGLMRYRSATVAGFHGLSRCPERVAKNGDTEAWRGDPSKPVRCAKLGKITVDLTTLSFCRSRKINASTYTQEKICSLAKEACHPRFDPWPSITTERMTCPRPVNRGVRAPRLQGLNQQRESRSHETARPSTARWGR